MPLTALHSRMASALSIDAGSCRVRPWRTSDLASLVRQADNPNVAGQMRDMFPHPYTRAHAAEWLRAANAGSPITKFAIEVGAEAVGGIGFMVGHDIERFSAEIGYWLGQDFWGRGIVTDAVRAVTRHAFDVHGLHRVFAVPFADNLASRRVLEKAGYTLEGIMRRSAVKAGVVRDQALYAIVR
jgi:RimJ/RimL family protein N-acetyltransferase